MLTCEIKFENKATGQWCIKNGGTGRERSMLTCSRERNIKNGGQEERELNSTGGDRERETIKEGAQLSL